MTQSNVYSFNPYQTTSKYPLTFSTFGLKWPKKDIEYLMDTFDRKYQKEFIISAKYQSVMELSVRFQNI